MYIYKRLVIARHERGLFFRDRSLAKILEPGVYHVFNPLGRISVEVIDINEPEFIGPYVDILVAEQRKLCEQFFQIIETGEHEVALIYRNGKLSDVAVPASRRLFWKGPVEIRWEVQNIKEEFALPDENIGKMAHSRAGMIPRAILNDICFVEVADNHVGLLLVNGELSETLSPGLYAYWKFNRRVAVEQVDLRLQTMEVQGQEILTRDKVTLRVNLSTQYLVIDPAKARNRLTNFADYLYREVQFALRQVVSARTLETLLSNKGELDQAIFELACGKVAEFGIDVKGVGIKDIILPGDMKNILNKVVETEKAAQANVIRRREETAATRSLLNTARLMDQNPTLLRLKELEVLEKVTEKVDKLTVFGGLDGVLKDTVRIGVKSD